MSHEDRRRILEAREWLRLGYATPNRIAELRMRITAKRGAEAAERLIEEMRRQWRTRSEWMGNGNG